MILKGSTKTSRAHHNLTKGLVAVHPLPQRLQHETPLSLGMNLHNDNTYFHHVEHPSATKLPMLQNGSQRIIEKHYKSIPFMVSVIYCF
jgi:hypothetical protein